MCAFRVCDKNKFTEMLVINFCLNVQSLKSKATAPIVATVVKRR